MKEFLQQAKQNRKFIDRDLSIQTWEDIEAYFMHLMEKSIDTKDDFEEWLAQRSELITVLEEEKAWRYIDLSCNTADEQIVEKYQFWVSEIEPHITRFDHKLDQKLIENAEIYPLPPEYEVFLRGIRMNLSLFREENVDLLSKLEVAEQEYSSITGNMTIEVNGTELTLQQANNFLKDTNRDLRSNVFDKICERRLADADQLDKLFADLVKQRSLIAQNAGYDNYLQFRFDQLNRFDYPVESCYEFHEAVKKHITPLYQSILEQRKAKLGIDELLPYDLDVDPTGAGPLQPFDSIAEFKAKSKKCLQGIDHEFANCLDILDKNGYLDLDSRKGKAPGGYNYPLFESNIPFVFMNATQNMRDVVTLLHESGHAVHSILSGRLPLVYFKEFPAEIAELASMSMELMSMQHWDAYFEEETTIWRAQKQHLEDIVQVLPWIAIIDKFQHRIYSKHITDPKVFGHIWTETYREFIPNTLSWEHHPEGLANLWQKQIHLFQFPLYYLEYGIAQLGALGIWGSYQQNPKIAVQKYKSALSLGYTKPLPELFETAGVPFSFNDEHIGNIAKLLASKIL